MKKKVIKLVLISLFLIFLLKLDRIKLYFANERYYTILSALRITKPHFKPYKSFYDVFTQEGFSYQKNNSAVIAKTLAMLTDKTLELADQSIIPTITHHIYFTNPAKPVTLSPFYLENLKLTFKNLDALEPKSDWQHNIWTNDAALFPSEIANIHNVKIRNINEFAQHPLYADLIDSLAKGAEARAYFSACSDLVRFMAMQQFGGIYADMDYEIYNPKALYELMRKFDFIGGRERISIKSYYGSSFLAAKAHHPVIEEAVKIMYRNHHLEEDSPIYLKYPSIEFDRIYFNAPPLITVAYFSKNNINGNKDIILPPWMIYNKAFAEFKNNGCNYNKMTPAEVIKSNDTQTELLKNFISNSPALTPLDGKLDKNEDNIYYDTKYRQDYPIIGADMFCGTWVPDNNFKKIYYWNLPFMDKNNEKK